MAKVVRTMQEAVNALSKNWGACRDAAGLVMALEEMGILHIERPPVPETLIAEAKQWSRPGGFVDVTPDEMLRAARLISDLGNALAAALAKPSGICPNQSRS
jgi:hypothetical protein